MGFIVTPFLLHEIPLRDDVSYDTGLNIILAGWKETKNNFVPRLQPVRKVTRQSSSKPEFALIRLGGGCCVEESSQRTGDVFTRHATFQRIYEEKVEGEGEKEREKSCPHGGRQQVIFD